MSDDFFSIMASSWKSCGGRYKADQWGNVTLEAGRIIFGMAPHTTEYFTDADTVLDAVSTGRAASLNDLLQVAALYGTVRAGIRPYRVLCTMTVATGRCMANSAYGSGGGTQFLIPDCGIVSLLAFPRSQIYWFPDANGEGLALV
jgi:hypothetical protein